MHCPLVAPLKVGRPVNPDKEHDGQSFSSFFEGRRDRGGGLGLTDRVIAVGLEFPAPCGCGPWLGQRAVGPQPNSTDNSNSNWSR